MEGGIDAINKGSLFSKNQQKRRFVIFVYDVNRCQHLPNSKTSSWWWFAADASSVAWMAWYRSANRRIKTTISLYVK
jgi:hypothetical protein